MTRTGASRPPRQPLALLEVGASAGLCLYPDLFSYQYGHRPRLDPFDGPGPLVHCNVAGDVPVPDALPRVVWRAGIDLNPLDVADPSDVRWLETLIWPEQSSRREQLAAAVAIARTDPPLLVRGDLNDTVGDLIDQAPTAPRSSSSTLPCWRISTPPNTRPHVDDATRRRSVDLQ